MTQAHQSSFHPVAPKSQMPQDQFAGFYLDSTPGATRYLEGNLFILWYGSRWYRQVNGNRLVLAE